MEKILSSDDSFECLSISSVDSDSFSFMDSIKSYGDHNASSEYSDCDELSYFQDFNRNDLPRNEKVDIIQTSNGVRRMTIYDSAKNCEMSSPMKRRKIERSPDKKRKSRIDSNFNERRRRYEMNKKRAEELKKEREEMEERERQSRPPKETCSDYYTLSGQVWQENYGYSNLSNPGKAIERYNKRRDNEHATDLSIARGRLAQCERACLTKECRNNSNGYCKYFFEANRLEDENRDLKDQLEFCRSRNKLLESFYRTVNYKVRRYEEYGRKELRFDDCDKSVPQKMSNAEIHYMPIEAEDFLKRVRDNSKRLDKLIDMQEMQE